MKERKLRMGMIGGGGNAFIGPIHLRAAIMENDIELVCGCFSRTYETSLATGKKWFVPENRIYPTYQEMLEKEAQLPESERMDFVAIVTPNKFHFEQAYMALDKGFNVVLDKPMTFSLDEAIKLRDKVEETGLVFALTHTYTAFPAMKEIKRRIQAGSLGKLRRVCVEYLQGWLSERIELLGGNNAGWRTDPKLSGKGGCLGDIATHAWHLCEYATGLKVTELCAELHTFVEGRPIDDDAAAFLHFEQGVTGTLHATQIAVGEENDIHIRIYGEKGGLIWREQEPNTIIATWTGRPAEVIRIGSGHQYLDSWARFNTRTPGGHPEGYIEAFSNIYRNFALTVRAKKAGETPKPEWLDFPTVHEGLRGMQFIETMFESNKSDGKWTKWIEK